MHIVLGKRRVQMVRKNLIAIGCIAMAAILISAAYAEKDKACSIPAAVESAAKALFPNRAIEKIKAEEVELKAYEVEMKDASVNIGADGTIISFETVEDMNSLPAPVAAAVKAQGGKINMVEKEVIQAELKLVKLENPRTAYEAKITKDGKEIEVVIAADGKVLEQKVEQGEGAKAEEKCSKEKDEDKDEDDKE